MGREERIGGLGRGEEGIEGREDRLGRDEIGREEMRILGREDWRGEGDRREERIGREEGRE